VFQITAANRPKAYNTAPCARRGGNAETSPGTYRSNETWSFGNPCPPVRLNCDSRMTGPNSSGSPDT
jgi:hypothetical protein